MWLERWAGGAARSVRACACVAGNAGAAGPCPTSELWLVSRLAPPACRPLASPRFSGLFFLLVGGGGDICAGAGAAGAGAGAGGGGGGGGGGVCWFLLAVGGLRARLFGDGSGVARAGAGAGACAGSGAGTAGSAGGGSARSSCVSSFCSGPAVTIGQRPGWYRETTNADGDYTAGTASSRTSCMSTVSGRGSNN